MTQRERQASGGVTGAAPPGGPHRPLLSPGAGRPSGNPASVSPWASLFQGASPEQQRELLALAARQGVLYAHQIPAANNGAAGDPVRSLLGRLLSGSADDLEPVRPTALVPVDADLDDVQRDAVARALATPDVCVIQGLPGTGKSRVVTEIITQATQRGERVLFLAAAPEPVDRVLEALAGREQVCALRLLGRDERAEDLPSSVKARTLADQERRLREESIPQACREAEAAEERCRQRQAEAPVWDQLLDLAGQLEQAAGRLRSLEEAHARAGAEVEAAAAALERAGAEAGAAGRDSFAVQVQAALQARDDALARLNADLAKVTTRLAELRREQEGRVAQLEALAPLVEARRHRRWWTRAWWQTLFRGKVLRQSEELQASRQPAEAELQGLEEECQRLRAEQDEARRDCDAERAELVAAETARRQTDLASGRAALEQERRQLEDKWGAARGRLPAGTTPPTAPTRRAVEEARDASARVLRHDEGLAAFGRRWVACLEEHAAAFPQRFAGLANVIAGTPQGLAGFPGADAFDLLVFEAADQVTESEFLAVAGRARRWVLVGQPAEAGGPVAPGFFARLWQHLHCDPRRLPYAWVEEKDGLCCRLRPVTPAESSWLETERVADRPDVELRILAAPRREPELAEVVFPPSTSIAQAKEYLFHELEELPVRALGASVSWAEDAERVVLRLGDGPAPGAVPIALAPGVREMLHARPGAANGAAPPVSSWHTCCVEFERGAGWHRARAEQWVRDHLGLCDLGRTARLDVPYRMRRELAAFVADILYPGEYRLPAAEAAPELTPPVVEFLPVPPAQEALRVGGGPRGHRPSRKGGATAAATLPRRGGAGLELDMADARHRDRLPSELRPDLPACGLVNYLEAQAVVRALEAVVADPAVRAAAGAGGVAVLALYPAQAALIRRLMQQAPALAAADVEVRVDVPEAFRERECLVALVSLTRSHTHRAVSYGAGPGALALALTRARSRLILVGDAGTLTRRSQWTNPLDHLDAAASAREHAVVARLVDYLHGRGAYPHAFQLREGSLT